LNALFQRGARPLVLDGILSEAIGSLAGGAFLSAFALALGASQFQIGLLAALPPLGQILQIPAILIIRKLGERKRLALLALIISRLIWLLIAALPFALSGSKTPYLLAMLVMLSTAAGNIVGVAWISWIRDLVPVNVMGSYFSRRIMLSNISGIVCSLSAGLFIDFWNGFSNSPAQAYSILFLLEWPWACWA
jgi:MFS family permease